MEHRFCSKKSSKKWTYMVEMTISRKFPFPSTERERESIIRMQLLSYAPSTRCFHSSREESH